MSDSSVPDITSSSTSSKRIHFVFSFADLFSGGKLSDCHHAEDESCAGGVAAIAAFARHLTNDGSPRLMMQRLDKQSQFVQTHPLGWTVNRLILHEYYGYNFFIGPPSLLLQNKQDFAVSQRDISDLQTHAMPLVLTNAAVPPQVSWYSYVQRVHYHADTNLAILALAGDGEPLTSEDQVGAARAALVDVAKQNEERRDCDTSTQSEYGTFLEQNRILFANWTEISKYNDSIHNSTGSGNNCWIPVLYYSDSNVKGFAGFVNAMAAVEHPPAIIIDGGGNDDKQLYTYPSKVNTPNCAYADSMWVVSMYYSGSDYYQHTFTLREDNRRFAQVDLTILDLHDDMLPEYKDEGYAKDILFLRQLADQAEANDPVVGTSTEMPLARVDEYRRCQGGECEQGNLFTDALRWKANSDVAFCSSGGLRGSGWPAGNVTISNIWNTLPFPNSICTGVMSGVSLFTLLDYSIGVATFESLDTEEGGRLLQVSGVKIVYNTQLKQHRVISIDVWDKATRAYKPVERLQLYKFATDSYICGAYDPFSTLVGEDLVIDGEKPGIIEDVLLQTIVGEYLSAIGYSYNATRQGRLVNNTLAMEPLNLIQNDEGCPPQTYWVESKLSCMNCPNSSHVVFSDRQLEFQAESGLPDRLPGRIVLVNREMEAFQVVPKGIPDWLALTSATVVGDGTRNSTVEAQTQAQVLNTQLGNDEEGHSKVLLDGSPTLLKPGDSLALDFLVTAEQLEVGTALGTVSFGVLDGGHYSGCTDNGDSTFDVLLRVFQAPQNNQLGIIRYVGFSLMGIALLTSLSFAIWTTQNRTEQVVRKMQPLFLIMICVGVGVISLAMGSLSFDDQVVSLEWCNFACMSMPWFVSMGWTITFAAIYSKLWRINKLFGNAQYRRIKVSERDALVTFAVLFVLNFVILLIWTLVDPIQWVRRSVDGESWNTYGICSSTGAAGEALMGLTIGVNVFAMVLAAFEAYKARSIGGGFSESKQLGLAIYTWLQVIAVGLPVLFLIDTENVTARYFLQVGLIFCLSITMLLNIFIPMVLHMRRERIRDPEERFRSVKVSGLVNVGGVESAHFAPSMNFPPSDGINERQIGMETRQRSSLLVIGHENNITNPSVTTQEHDSTTFHGVSKTEKGLLDIVEH